ncbi:fibronectin type III domain-containing protein [Actinoplanes sp. GCM10030250]|uniref:fibronectin type III domain-containing protein n=1 Tax=Actinoplanes sp. GCM10030250 TaxID=3273376 RepID=UPI00361C7846
MLGYRKRSAVVLSVIALPLLLAGCGSTSEKVQEEKARTGNDWILVEQGKATPSPTVKVGKASPTPADTLPTLPAVTTSPTVKPTPSCTPVQSIGGINGLDVVPGSTSAVVTWYHPGGGNIIDYRVTAMTQDLDVGSQTEVGWTKVTPATCGDVSATVTGLEAGTPYVFSVDVVKKRAGRDGTYTETVARSQVVSTT